MNIKKTLVVAGAAATVGLAGISGLGVVSAATDTSASDTNNGKSQSSLITKLADKFHLNKQDVQAVFDEDHTAREAEMQQKLDDRLTQLVTDGKLTQAQKDLIVAKQAAIKTALQTERASLQTKTQQERRDYMEQQRDDLQQWAEDNNIPTQYLRFVLGGHQGPGGPGGPMDSDTSDNSKD